MSRLQKYLALSAAGRTIVRRSLLLLPIAAVLLRACGMARTTALLRHLERHAEPAAHALAPRELARLVDAAASALGAQCLPRSLVLAHLLRKRGIAAEIRLGVSKQGEDKLSAHAWVELDGLPLNDGADVFERYAAFPAAATSCRAERP